MNDTIFTKIIKGEIPCHKIYEDDKTLAFLDIHPALEGHTLVISKKQVEFVWDLDDEDYQAVMQTVKKVGRRLRDVMGTKYVGQAVVGTDVPHVHVHLLPFNKGGEMKQSFVSESLKLSDDYLAALAEKLRF